jgi:probable rRNA maturation factor
MEDDQEYDIAVACESKTALVPDKRLKDVITAALRRHDAASARITVAVVDDARIADLNHTHLQHAGPTDVLTFDLRDEPADEGEHAPAIEGEIVISLDTAEREASARGHSAEAELALYAVHGALHLLGYDDQTEVDAARMHAVEDEILVSVGLGSVFQGTRTCG